MGEMISGVEMEGIQTDAPETGESGELADALPYRIIGEANPYGLSPEEFSAQPDLLFHGSKTERFTVDEEFQYEGSPDLNGFTLGYGVYLTPSAQRAEKYADLRGEAEKGSVAEVLPAQLQILDLVSPDGANNVPFPQELAQRWQEFARPQIEQKIADAKAMRDQENYDPWYGRYMAQQLAKLNKLGEKDPQTLDLRSDILGSKSFGGEFSFNPVFADIWSGFCAENGIEGIRYLEGGDADFKDESGVSLVVYNLKKIGTREDWQRRLDSAATA
jgi:hypothetical protein